MEEHRESADRTVVSTGTMEAIVSIILMLIAAVVIYDSLRLGHRWGDDGPQSGYFPFYIALLLLAASGTNLLLTLTGKGRRAVNAKPFVTWRQFKPVLAVFAPLFVYVLIMQYVGLYVAAAIFIATFMRINGKYGFGKIAQFAIGVPVFVFVLFERWFLVPLPKGPVEALLGF
jgi:hypothetical protein